jgi:type VI secretion system protein ImpH
VAGASRMESARLASPEVALRLAAEPTAFDFFQAVRLLERLFPERARVGGFGVPAEEVATFSAAPSIAFPACEVQDLEVPGEGPARMRVNIMGLIGPLGVLPYHYTQIVAERVRARDRALQSFLGMFEHRIISLFYRAWEKQHFTAGYERDHAERLTEHFLDLVGLGLPGVRGRMPVPDEAFIFYSGVLAPQPRSAAALEALLEDFFEVPIQVEQFVGGWYPLAASTQCSLGAELGASDQVGLGAVVGDEVWDEQARVRLRLGPLTRQQYEHFLPTGAAYPLLRTLTRFFSHDQFDFEVQLVLARDEVPPCTVGAAGEAASPLGWGTWLRTQAFARDADETLLTL